MGIVPIDPGGLWLTITVEDDGPTSRNYTLEGDQAVRVTAIHRLHMEVRREDNGHIEIESAAIFADADHRRKTTERIFSKLNAVAVEHQPLTAFSQNQSAD